MAKEMVDQLVANAKKAAAEFRGFTQEQVDKITAAMDAASVANEVKLGELAVEETGIGRADHKAIKNHLGAHVVYEYFKGQKICWRYQRRRRREVCCRAFRRAGGRYTDHQPYFHRHVQVFDCHEDP